MNSWRTMPIKVKRPKAETPKEPRESFWLSATRENFSTTCAEHFHTLPESPLVKIRYAVASRQGDV